VWRDGDVLWQAGGAASGFYSICVDGGAVYAGGMAPDERAFYWKSGGGGGARYLSPGRGAAFGI
jgi:hypothetical protein